MSIHSLTERAATAETADETYVQDLSHELRAPLTVLDLKLQLLARYVSADAEASGLLAEIRDDVRGMVDVVDDVLLLSRGPDEREQCRSDVRAVAERLRESLTGSGASGGVRIALGGARDLIAAIPPTSLRRSISALIDNAVKHSPLPGRVVVSVHRLGSDVAIDVSDSGDGVDPAVLARIFDRNVFSESEAPGRPSFGIGLALVHDTAARYGGRVSVLTTGPHGTTMRLRLPEAAPER